MKRIYDLTAPVVVPGAEPMLFNSLRLGRRPGVAALAGSVAVHALLITAVTGFSQYMAWLHEDDVNWADYRVEPLRLHLAEPLYFKADGPGNRRTASARSEEHTSELQSRFGISYG